MKNYHVLLSNQLKDNIKNYKFFPYKAITSVSIFFKKIRNIFHISHMTPINMNANRLKVKHFFPSFNKFLICSKNSFSKSAHFYCLSRSHFCSLDSKNNKSPNHKESTNNTTTQPVQEVKKQSYYKKIMENLKAYGFKGLILYYFFYLLGLGTFYVLFEDQIIDSN